MEELLKVRDRIETCRLSHPRFEQARAKLKLALEGKCNIVFLVGTTGVGKGVLAETLADEMNEVVKGDPTQLRAISSKLASRHGNSFSWTDSYVEILEQTGDPLPDEKIDREERLARLRRGEKLGGGLTSRKGSPSALRKAATAAIRDRGIEVALLDEGENLAVQEKNYGFANRLRVIRDMSMALSGDPIAGQKRGCKMVLIATPDVLGDVMQASSEIVRRMTIVDFRRYALLGGIKGPEYKGFQSIVHGLLHFFPGEHRPRLSTSNVLSLQMDSLGLIGVLVSWFVEAINVCWHEGAESLEWRHFEETALTDEELRNLSDQCVKDDETLGKLTRRSGCGIARREALRAEKKREKEAASAKTASVETDTTRRGTRVGEQKPVRRRLSGG